jgi:hypothetical protein
VVLEGEARERKTEELDWESMPGWGFDRGIYTGMDRRARNATLRTKDLTCTSIEWRVQNECMLRRFLRKGMVTTYAARDMQAGIPTAWPLCQKCVLQQTIFFFFLFYSIP